MMLFLSACSLRTSPEVNEAEVIPTSLPTSRPVDTAPPTANTQPVEDNLDRLATQTPSPVPQPDPTLAVPAFPITGIEMNRIDAPGAIELVEQSGAYWIRRNALLWSTVESQEGGRNWGALARLEEEIRIAADRGLQVILIIQSTPFWAQLNPGVTCGAVKPDKLPAFASFLHDLVARYSVPPYNVKYWEIANEPDIAPGLVGPDSMFGCWGKIDDPYGGGGDYAEMLKAVYPQVKSADPQSQVLVGGLLLDCDPVNPPEEQPGSGKTRDCSSSLFLEGILQNGGGDSFDGISFHAYDYYSGVIGQYENRNWHSSWNTLGPVLIAKARFLRSLLNLHGYPQKFLINSEVALLCGRTGNEAPCQDEVFNQSKAYYASQAYASAAAEGLRGNLWYSLTGWRASGLVDGNLQPLPVYDAIRFSASQLNQAAFGGEISQYPGVGGYEFVREGRRVWFLWSRDGEEHTIQPSSPPAAIYDVFGATAPLSDAIKITIAPVYIEFAPD